MRARNLLSLAAGVCVFAIVLAGASPPGAVAGGPRAPAVSIPTEPDIYIQDWTSPVMSEMRTDVAYNPDDDEYLVVFDWDHFGAGDRDVMFVAVDASGGISPTPLGVVPDATWDDSNPAVAYNPDDGNYMVVWERRDATDVGQIFGTIVTDYVAGDPIFIKTGNADHLNPDVAYSTSAGQYLVVWEDHGAGWTPPPDIDSASYSGTGDWVASLHVAPDSDGVAGAQTNPAVAAHGTLPRWLVVWEDSRSVATTGVRVWGQQVAYDSDSSSLSLFPSAAVAGAAQGDADSPDVAWGQVGGPGGEYLVVWMERVLAVAYNPGTGHALVAWHDDRYEAERGPWGIWGRLWVAVDRVYLPLVLRSAP